MYLELTNEEKISRHEKHLNQSLLDSNDSKSILSSAPSSKRKPKKEPSLLSPLKGGKFRPKKNELSQRFEENDTQSQIRPDEPQEFQLTQVTNNDFVFNKYDIWDLTYSLVNAKIDKKLLLILFVIQVFVRYFSFLSLIYITVQTYSQHWQWIFILVITSTLYFICIVKISLKPAETQSEFILKQSFNSLEENDVSDYFHVISAKKFFTSALRGMVPPEFSCLYIKDAEKRTQIYAMINYIYSSIEAVIYYPFFIIYMIVIINKDKQFESKILFYASLGLICLSEVIFIVFSLYLVVFGCRKKGYIKTGKQK